MDLDFDLCWQQIRKGDEKALENLCRRSFRSLVCYAKDITGNPQLAEEAVQDVLLKIWKNNAGISVGGSFKAYLFRSVHNHSLNIVRQQYTRKESVNMLTSDHMWRFVSETCDMNDNLIDRIYSDETEKIIDRLVEELPEQCRKIFVKSRYESLNIEQIATQMGISENTVKTQIYRALKKIASGLGRK